MFAPNVGAAAVLVVVTVGSRPKRVEPSGQLAAVSSERTEMNTRPALSKRRVLEGPIDGVIALLQRCFAHAELALADSVTVPRKPMRDTRSPCRRY